jgi:hypothetical protein
MAMPVSAFGAQAASGAQMISVTRAPAQNSPKRPSRTRTHAPAANNAPPANNAQPANNAPLAKSTPAAQAPAAKGPARAPSKPPLGSGGTEKTFEEEASSSVSQSGGDPLVDNGLSSPLCRKSAELSSLAARDCRISHFDAAQAPTGNYGFDVHINTGVTDVANDLDVYILNPVQWSWTLLVAVVHLVIVVLEWSYTIDPLETSVVGGITTSLAKTQVTFTHPWLELALAVAAMFALYNGIVRRRVAQTLGEVTLMALMMMGGLWVILNPLGTIGALDEWANEASLGTLAAVATGTPEDSGRTLGESMQSIFSGAIGGPWCYLEFGKVGWCESEHKDSRLVAVADRIATKERAKIGSQSAELLGAARTNGELFLALPANGPQRNSINDSGSLFNVLCGHSSEPCQGPTAGEAEFRTGGGTPWRVLGLFLFWVGVLGMVSVLGFIALHLLTAALFSLFYLLMAPAAVIAPALGDGGRAAFRNWATRLLGAICAKLIYSFVLGVVLLMQQTMLKVHTFGWAGQWLLVSTMWWWLYFKRHQVDGFAKSGYRGDHRHEHRSLLRRARERAQNPPEAVRAGKWVKDKLRTPPPSVGQRKKLAQAGLARAKGIADGQVKRTLDREHSEAHALVQAAPETQARIAAKQAQLKRVKRQSAVALASGDGPQAARLAVRAKRIEGEVAHEQKTLDAARKTVDDGQKTQRRTGSVHTREQGEQRERFLDRQAALPAARERRAGAAGGGRDKSEQRDYAALAGLAGYGRREYEGLDGRRQREARLEIDRELAARKVASVAARDVAASGEVPLKSREQKKLDKAYDRTLEQGMKAAGHELPSSLKSPSKRPSPDAPSQGRRADGRSNGATSSSSVMRDVHEVAARRKRQLGRESRR